MKRIYERGDIAEDNQMKFARVEHKYENIQAQLSCVRFIVQDNVHAAGSLREMEDALEVDFKRVVALEEVITSFMRTNRVKRMLQIMSNYEDLEGKRLQFLGGNASPIHVQHQAPNNVLLRVMFLSTFLV